MFEWKASGHHSFPCVHSLDQTLFSWHGTKAIKIERASASILVADFTVPFYEKLLQSSQPSKVCSKSFLCRLCRQHFIKPESCWWQFYLILSLNSSQRRRCWCICAAWEGFSGVLSDINTHSSTATAICLLHSLPLSLRSIRWWRSDNNTVAVLCQGHWNPITLGHRLGKVMTHESHLRGLEPNRRASRPIF